MTVRKRIAAAGTAVVLVLGALLLTGGTAQAASPFKIQRIYYNSPGTDSFSNLSINSEYVLVRNLTAQTQTLTGWRVIDATRHVYTFPTTAIPAGGSIYLRTGKGGNSATTRYWQSNNYVWNNDRDTAYLTTPGGTVMQACSYNNPSASYRDC